MDNQTENQKESTEQDQLSFIKGAIEALLFVNEQPITLDQLKKLFKTYTPNDIKQIVEELSTDLQQKKNGMQIVEIAGGYQMLTNPDYASYVREFYKTKHKEKLSKPALESLAIIAYKQPVTRSDIELIRGVNSDGVVMHLVEKELIKIVGRKDIPGRPYLYGTTKQFLEYFGLKSLEGLPNLEEFPTLPLPKEEQEEISTQENVSNEKEDQKNKEEPVAATEQLEESKNKE